MNDFEVCVPEQCSVRVSARAVRLGGQIVTSVCQSGVQRLQSVPHCPIILRPAGSLSAADALKGSKLF